jgi:uncharacterized coiled-coil DUF342 family protein
MDVHALKAGIYALIREANELDAEVEEAASAAQDYERNLSVPKAERLRSRTTEGLYEAGVLSRDPNLDLLRAELPALAARLPELSERFAKARETTERLSS